MNETMNVISKYLMLCVVNLLIVTTNHIFGVISLMNFTSQDYPEKSTVTDVQSFDFIVVGAGSAGSVVANRLTEIDHWNVLLIEAGDDQTLLTNNPGLSALLGPSLPEWNYFSENDGFSSQAVINKRIHQTQSKLFGGCSSTNYMFFVRGNRLDYDSWAKKNKGWDFDSVLPYFKKSERLENLNITSSNSAHLHGTQGPVGVTNPLWKERTEHYFEAFRENGHEILLDTNGEQQLGYSAPQFNIVNGVRQSSIHSYIRPIMNRTNFHLLRNTIVTRVVLDDSKQAMGVEVKLSDKSVITILVRKEVILAAGAINSPTLLMRSGIGPKENLKEMDIDVVFDSPKVGENLQDHLIVPVLITGGQNSSLLDNWELLKNLDNFPNTTIMGHVAINRSQKYPDYQITALPLPRMSPFLPLVCTYIFNLKSSICSTMSAANVNKKVLLALVTFLHPESRGHIKLQNKNFDSKPLIYKGSFTNPIDIEKYSEIVEDYIKITDTSYMRRVKSEVVNLGVSECSNFTFGTHDYWKCFVVKTAGTQYHVAGTCAMGPEGEGVVDENLQVRGVKNLRVIDASIMPTIVSGNLFAPVLMIAEKGSDIIKTHHL